MRDFTKKEPLDERSIIRSGSGRVSDNSNVNNDQHNTNSNSEYSRPEEPEILITPEEKNTTKLLAKLSGLGVKARFVHYVAGPVVCNYYFTISDGTPISKVVNKSEDLALALGAESCLVTREQGYICISIPNKNRKTVEFKENLHWFLNNEDVQKAEIPILTGVNTIGDKSFFDLTTCPHILMAGSTNSGKSVYTSAIITSLVYRYSSSDLELYLVDTKRVDLPLFEKLPHVLAMADDIKSFHQKIGVDLMLKVRSRLFQFQNAQVRNILEYKTKIGHMPYVICIIDELADILDLDKALDRKKDSEYEGVPTVKAWLNQITRIARAAGVHLIACTQRSSVKVIDGDIKANLPCRIALRLPTGVDSRTIIGDSGAESLLGKGDMLIQRPEKDVIERYHGPFVSMNDITELVNNYDMLKNVLGGR